MSGSNASASTTCRVRITSPLLSALSDASYAPLNSRVLSSTVALSYCSRCRASSDGQHAIDGKHSLDAPLSQAEQFLCTLRSKWTHFKEKLIGDTDPSDMMNDIICTTVSPASPPLLTRNLTACAAIIDHCHPAPCHAIAMSLGT